MSADAEYAEGLRLHDGEDYEQARNAYRSAARAGHARACVNLAHLLETGRGGAVDVEEAMSWLREAADRGDLLGQANLGRLLQEYGAAAEAIVWLDRAAGAGSDDARVRAAIARLEDGAGGRDAITTLREMAESHPVAATGLASAFEHGWGVDQDLREAERLYRHGSSIGGSSAAFDLAMWLLQGHEGHAEPGAEDIEEALGLLEQAADDGLFAACAELGEILASGRYGVIVDDDRAVSLLERATNHVDPRAKGVLAWLALNDRAPTVSPGRAFRLCRDAAEADDGVANRLLALMYRRGFGVRRDAVEARRRAEKAVELGEDPGLLEVVESPPLRAHILHRIQAWTGGAVRES